MGVPRLARPADWSTSPLQINENVKIIFTVVGRVTPLIFNPSRLLEKHGDPTDFGKAVIFFLLIVLFYKFCWFIKF